jgi:carbon storage regulator
MLVLQRALGQTIRIGDQIEVTVLRVEGKKVRIGVMAPEHDRIMRAELQDDCHRHAVAHEN